MKKWMLRSCSSAQCSPALGLFGCIVVFALTVYVYRQVILTTIIAAVEAALGITIFTVTVVLVLHVLRWHRADKRAHAVLQGTAEEVATDSTVAAIANEADWLAAEGTELAFDEEGNLKVKQQ